MKIFFRDSRVWHRWFAWHPIVLTRYVRESEDSEFEKQTCVVWLETIERKCSGCFGNEYRFPSEK